MSRITIFKRGDGEFVLRSYRGSAPPYFYLRNFKKIYNELEGIDETQNLYYALLRSSNTTSQAIVERLYRTAYSIVYNCTETGVDWKYNRATGKWRKVTANV